MTIKLNDADYKLIHSTCLPNIKRLRSGIKDAISMLANQWLTNQNILNSTKLKAHSNHSYQYIRSQCCIMKGYHNHAEGVCDMIADWTPTFEAAMKQIVCNHIAFYKDSSVRDQPFVDSLPGANHSRYNHTENSGRHYHNLQNMSKNIKHVTYENCDDIDIVFSFGSIFCAMLESNNSSPFCYKGSLRSLELLKNKEEMIQVMLYDGLARTAKDAKNMRSRLFNHKIGKDGIIIRHRKTGVQWYDDLADFIYDVLRANDVHNSHLYFTIEEQKIIAQAYDIVGTTNVLINEHDGMKLKPGTVTSEILDKLNSINPHIRWKHTIMGDN